MRVSRDESGFGKVDPVMALFNAAHLMSLNPEVGGSVYDDLARHGKQALAPSVSALSGDEEAEVLRNPAHPRWQEVRDRFERRFAGDEFEDAF
jgi:hypothetical protein